MRKVARLDVAATAERLTEEVFNSFPSLYQMIPVSSRRGAADLLEASEWPGSGPPLRLSLLERARRFREGLETPDERFVAIAGVGQETVTAVSKGRDGSGLVYTITRHGDGTVPTESAALDGVSTYFANTAHSDLTRDARVASAIVDILRKGSTSRLPTRWRSHSRAQARISDRELRLTHTEKVEWASLTPAQRRDFLEGLNEPPKLRLKVPGGRPRRSSRSAPSTRPSRSRP